MNQLVKCAILIITITVLGSGVQAESRKDLDDAKKQKQDLSKRSKSESAMADDRKAKAEKDELKYLEELESV